jgi:hypothetical protein
VWPLSGGRCPSWRIVTSLSGPAKEDGDDAGHYAPGTPKHLTICQMFWTNKRENHTGVKE